MTTSDLIEQLDSLTRKASNHHRGFESQNFVSLFFVEEIDFRFLFSLVSVCFFFCCCCCFLFVFHESFMYRHMLMHPIYFIQRQGQADTISFQQRCEGN